jgi:ribosomal protein S18 acetylase RimI-like enzyme
MQAAEHPASAIEGLVIREIAAADFSLLWPIFRDVVAAGDTYSYPPDISFEEARRLWTSGDARCFIAEFEGRCVGGYLLHANQPGLGDHVANCGYMVTPHMRGRGIAGAMCAHSLVQARNAGFTAMQFNYVVSTNESAVRLWRKFGFAVVGRVPNAFRHATLGSTDVLVMHRFL